MQLVTLLPLPSDNYTKVPNHLFRDRTLKALDLVLLITIMSHRDTYQLSLSSLQDGPEGRDAVRNAIKRLKEAGYLHIVQVRNKTTKLFGTAVMIRSWEPLSEEEIQESLRALPDEVEPLPENPSTDSEPLPENPSSGFLAPKEYKDIEDQENNHHHAGAKEETQTEESQQASENQKADSENEKKTRTESHKESSAKESSFDPLAITNLDDVQTFGLKRTSYLPKKSMSVADFEQLVGLTLGISFGPPQRALVVISRYTKAEIVEALNQTAKSANKPGWAYFIACLDSESAPERPKKVERLSEHQRNQAAQWLAFEKCGHKLPPERKAIVEKYLAEKALSDWQSKNV